MHDPDLPKFQEAGMFLLSYQHMLAEKQSPKPTMIMMMMVMMTIGVRSKYH